MPYALLGVEWGLQREVRNTRERREKGQQKKTKKQKEGEIQCVVLAAPNTRMMSLYNNLQFAIFITAPEIYIFKGIAFK